VAVSDLSFELRPGVTGLLGPNGAGKTTTLKAICGLLHPSQGEVLVFGRPLLNDPMLYRAIGVVPDGDRLYPRLTVASYVRLHADLQGVEKPGEAAARAIAEVGLTELAGRRLRGLSKGERQRTKVAGAIVHQPAMLVLDEPMTGMDPGQRAHFIDLIRSVGAAGVTVLVSSHILTELQEVADRAVIVARGRSMQTQRLDGEAVGATSTGWRIDSLDPDLLSGFLRQHRVPAQQVHGGMLEVEVAGEESAARLLTDLIGAGVRVTAFTPTRGALESAYLAATEDRQ
jgi:ABC-2 type transport system ATP-binding protein